MEDGLRNEIAALRSEIAALRDEFYAWTDEHDRFVLDWRAALVAAGKLIQQVPAPPPSYIDGDERNVS